jgi:hypothetical protein
MSTIANFSAPAAVRVDGSGKHLLFWMPLLILVAITACAIAATFYADAPYLDASIVGP